MARNPKGTDQNKRATVPEPSEDGVDQTLIRWVLSLTPLERLRAAEGSARSQMRLRACRTKP